MPPSSIVPDPLVSGVIEAVTIEPSTFNVISNSFASRVLPATGTNQPLYAVAVDDRLGRPESTVSVPFASRQ